MGRAHVESTAAAAEAAGAAGEGEEAADRERIRFETTTHMCRRTIVRGLLKTRSIPHSLPLSLFLPLFHHTRVQCKRREKMGGGKNEGTKERTKEGMRKSRRCRCRRRLQCDSVRTKCMRARAMNFTQNLLVTSSVVDVIKLFLEEI